MVYEIYDGPRQLKDGTYYFAYCAWTSEARRQAGLGSTVIRTPEGKSVACDLANDHLAQFRTDHTRLVLDAQGRATRISDGAKIPLDELEGPASDYETEQFTWPIAEQAELAISQYLVRAAARNERGSKVLPIDTSRPEAVEEHLERRRRGK